MSLSTKPTATVSQFAAVLKVTNWYNLGIFLGAECHELDDIDKNHSKDPLRCLIELYKCLEKKGGDLLTWESTAAACRQLNENALAEKIHSEYITPALQQQQLSDTQVSSLIPMDQATDSTTEATTVSTDDDIEVIEAEKIEEIASEYFSLSIKYNTLLTNVKRAFNEDRLGEVQDCLKRLCGVTRLPPNKVTVELVFDRVEEQCSLLNLDILKIVIEEYIPQNESLLADVDGFVSAVNIFKDSANMVALVQLIQQNRQQIATAANGCQKIVELKVRKFWKRFTAEKLEKLLNELFQTLYRRMRRVAVKPGCICLNWVIYSDINTTKLLPVLPLELVRLIGVIYLHIGSDVIYNIEGEGCESIEAAMIQAIELKNMRAIKLLLAVGCNPEVATYNRDNAVINIVNIRAIKSKESSSSGSSHSVDHVCILGHNKHVEAIVNPSSEPKCDCSCIAKKMNKQLHQEIDQLKYEIKQKDAENTLLKGTNEILIKESKVKDAENVLLKGTNESLIKESKKKDAEIESLKTARLPPVRKGILPRSPYEIIQYLKLIDFNINTLWTRFMRLLGMRADDIIKYHRLPDYDNQMKLEDCLDEWMKNDPDLSWEKIDVAIKFVNEHECAVTVFHLLKPELSKLIQECDNISVVTSTLKAEEVIAGVLPMVDGKVSEEQLIQSFEMFIAQKPSHNLFRLVNILTRFPSFKKITTPFELECELCSLHEPPKEDYVSESVPLSPTVKGKFASVIEEYRFSIGEITDSITKRQDNDDIRRYINRSGYCDDLDRFTELSTRDILQSYFRRTTSVTHTNQLKKFLRRFGLLEETKKIEDFEKTRDEFCATLTIDKLIDNKTLSFTNIDECNEITFTIEWEISDTEFHEITEILLFAFEDLAMDVLIKMIRKGN